MARRIVFLAISGCYSNRYPCGIFPTAEAAIAALHRPGWIWTRTLWHQASPRRHGEGHQEWSNNQDWDNAISIDSYEYDDEAIDERSPDRIIARWDANSRQLDHKEIDAATADRVVAAESWRDARAILDGCGDYAPPT